jgi:hypothetical protein
MALIPLIVLAGLVLLARKKSGDWLQALVAGVVAWGGLLVLLTEGLSLVRAVSAPWLAIAWTVCGVLVAFAYRKSTAAPKQRLVFSLADRDMADRLAIGFIAASVLITFVIGIFAVPSLWDAHTYHVPRVLHWAQNQSVAYYPTHIQRQLWSSPGAEFITLQFYVLAGTDRFIALVPWCAFVIGIVTSSLIAKELGAPPRGQLMAAMFAASIPGAIAQATGSEVEIIAGMWICCFVWLALRVIKRNDFSWPLVFLAGSSLGLALLTKPTAYMFTTPFLLWFAADSFSRSWKRAIVLCVSIGVIAVGLNAFQYHRNMSLYGRPVGGPGSRGTQNYTRSFGTLASNVVRNSALHFGTRSSRFNLALFNAIADSHRAFGIPLNDTSMTLVGSSEFEPVAMTFSELSVGSPLHVVLFTAAAGFLILYARQRSRRTLLFFSVAIVAAYLLFAFLLRWGPWNARLHLPLLMLASAPVGWWIGSYWGRRSRTLVTGLLSVGALPALLLNPDRPLIRHRPVYAIPREERYFVEVLSKYPSYRGAADYITAAGCRRIGLWVGWNDWEYPFWALLRDRSFDGAEIRHVQVVNKSATMSHTEGGAFSPCILIAVKTTDARGSLKVPPDFTRVWQKDSIEIFRPVAGLLIQTSPQLP